MLYIVNLNILYSYLKNILPKNIICYSNYKNEYLQNETQFCVPACIFLCIQLENNSLKYFLMFSL